MRKPESPCENCTIRDDEIMASWDAHDDNDISTERLIQMVADGCKCEADDVIETLSRQQDRVKGDSDDRNKRY